MTTTGCPECGTPMREIVWGYGTISDVLEAGDVVIGGCVVDVDDAGRAAALQCPICGTRADADGVALERPEPAAPAEHPFAVSFSSPPRGRWEATMTDAAPTAGAPQPADREQDDPAAPASPFDDEDFGDAPSAPGRWRERVRPYSSHDDELPPSPVAAPEHVEPYSSREDALPAGEAAWHERIPPYAGPGEGVPGEAIDQVPLLPEARVDAASLDTSDFTDAEEEGWPPRDGG